MRAFGADEIEVGGGQIKNVKRVIVENVMGDQVLKISWERVSEDSAILASITSRRKVLASRGSKKYKYESFPLYDTCLQCVNGYGRGSDKESGVLVSFHALYGVLVSIILTFVCFDDFAGLDFDKYYMDSFAALNRMK